MSRSLLVTGAAGFIGSHLCERLLAGGDRVTGIDNFDPFYPPAMKRANLSAARQHDRFDFHETDLRDTEAIRTLWQQTGPFDAVVHLAAKAGVRPSIADPVGYEQANVLATVNLLNLATRESPHPRFIFASSSSVYGNNQKVPFAEDDPVTEPISPYAATKRAGELISYTFHHLYALPVFCLRFFTVYGPRQRPDLAIHKFTARLLSGEPIDQFGDGLSSRDYTYIDDIIDGVTAAVDRCAGYEIINLGNSEPVTLADMIATIEQATGVAATIRALPAQPGDVERTCADISKAGNLLDYHPTTNFADGVGRFVEWYRAHLKDG
jgi:UDP-glucuronate 4-epimerase